MNEKHEVIIQILEGLEARLRRVEKEIDAIADERRNASKERFERIVSYFKEDLNKLKKLI